MNHGREGERERGRRTMLYNLRHSAAAARFLVTLSCDGRGVEGEANRGDQETRERERAMNNRKRPQVKWGRPASG